MVNTNFRTCGQACLDIPTYLFPAYFENNLEIFNSSVLHIRHFLQQNHNMILYLKINSSTSISLKAQNPTARVLNHWFHTKSNLIINKHNNKNGL